MSLISSIKFDEKGLVPVIAQDHKTNEVLMLAYMNKESLEKTIATGRAHYFSRSRNSLWMKGETSGHFQNVSSIHVDCDSDTLLIMVEQIGAACHTGTSSCFYRDIDANVLLAPEYSSNEIYSANVINTLYQTIFSRKEYPKEGSYTNYLFEKGIDKILKKVGEEAAEVIIAAKNGDNQELTYEVADLMYHLSVMMVNNGLEWQAIFDELEKRAGR